MWNWLSDSIARQTEGPVFSLPASTVRSPGAGTVRSGRARNNATRALSSRARNQSRVEGITSTVVIGSAWRDPSSGSANRAVERIGTNAPEW